jgi:hypothetical protein
LAPGLVGRRSYRVRRWCWWTSWWC